MNSFEKNAEIVRAELIRLWGKPNQWIIILNENESEIHEAIEDLITTGRELRDSLEELRSYVFACKEVKMPPKEWHPSVVRAIKVLNDQYNGEGV